MLGAGHSAWIADFPVWDRSAWLNLSCVLGTLCGPGTFRMLRTCFLWRCLCRVCPEPAGRAQSRPRLPGPGFAARARFCCPGPGFSARDAPRCLSPARRAGSPPFVLDPAQHCQAPPCSARCRLRLPQSSPVKGLASFQGRGSGLARMLPPNRCSCGTRTSKDTPHWVTTISCRRTAPGWRKTRCEVSSPCCLLWFLTTLRASDDHLSRERRNFCKTRTHPALQSHRLR